MEEDSSTMPETSLYLVNTMCGVFSNEVLGSSGNAWLFFFFNMGSGGLTQVAMFAR